jgi:hypothetical protein
MFVEKVIVAHIVTEFCIFYENFKFITVFTRAHHWFVSSVKLNYSMPFHSFLLKHVSALAAIMQFSLTSYFCPLRY